MIFGIRKMSLALLAMSATVPAFQAYAKPASQATERVYAMTNNATKNEVLVFAQGKDGSFESKGSFATGGRGSGGVSDPLESQGSLTVSDDHSLTLRSDRNRESKEHPFPFHESHMI